MCRFTKKTEVQIYVSGYHLLKRFKMSNSKQLTTFHASMKTTTFEQNKIIPEEHMFTRVGSNHPCSHTEPFQHKMGKLLSF